MGKTVVKIICFPLLAAGGFWLWTLVAQSSPRIFGANAIPVVSGNGRLIWGFGLTLVGAVIGAGYRDLKDRQGHGETRIKPREFLRSLVTLTDLWLGLFGAPIVFGMLLQTTGGISDAGFAVVALQNGFCCTLIIGGIVTQVVQQSGGMPADSNSAGTVDGERGRSGAARTSVGAGAVGKPTLDGSQEPVVGLTEADKAGIPEKDGKD